MQKLEPGSPLIGPGFVLRTLARQRSASFLLARFFLPLTSFSIVLLSRHLSTSFDRPHGGPARCGAASESWPARRSGKTTRLLANYRQALAHGPPGVALWLGPTHRAVSLVSEQIVGPDLPGCLNPNCLTFRNFAGQVLASEAPAMRPCRRPWPEPNCAG